MYTIIDWVTVSFGLKRRIAALLQSLSAVAGAIPGLSFLSPILSTLASYFGAVGIVHAAAAKTLTSINPFSTIAAFFSAFEIASKNIPILLPYENIIHSVAVLFSLLATGSALGGGKG